MALIGFLIFGLFLGALARLLIPGRQRIGVGMTLLVGVIGSVVGGMIANALGTGDIFELNFLGFVVALVTAVVAIVAADRAGIGAGPDRGRIERR